MRKASAMFATGAAAKFQRVDPTLGLRAGEGLKEKAQHLKRRLLKWIEARFLYGDFLVFRDAQGACLFSKRLEKGRFVWHAAKDGKVSVFSLMKESVCYAENEEPVPCGIQGTDGRAG